MQLESSLAFSLLSGLFAALSGFLGKIAFDPQIVVSTLNVGALIGKVAFDEHLSLVWWCGTTLILAGIYLISSDRNHGGNNKLE